MNDRDFMRYSRQILLDDIALDGQQKLLDSQVLIICLLYTSPSPRDS